MGSSHRNVTISMPNRLADEIDALREDGDYGVSEIYLYLIREGLRYERKCRRDDIADRKDR